VSGDAARPLAGWRIAVTRPREQAALLADELERLGAVAVVVPLIEIEPAPAKAALRAVARSLARTDWVVVTSANGVRALEDALSLVRGSDRTRIAAVGPATAVEIRRLGLEPSFVPDRFAAEEIAQGLGDVRGKRVLLLQSDLASRRLAADLAARGAIVDHAIAYATTPAQPAEEELQELRRGVDAILLASGSAARRLAALASDLPATRRALLVCIGPKTAAVAREAGLEVGLVAEEATAQGMIQAFVSHYGESA
jgi:uroporphyrinogen-III synthase